MSDDSFLSLVKTQATARDNPKYKPDDSRGFVGFKMSGTTVLSVFNQPSLQ
jgi:hypothetical protein